jgi:hypothetical protein
MELSFTKEIDVILDDAFKRCERSAQMKIDNLGFSELEFINKSLFDVTMIKLTHVFKLYPKKSLLVMDVGGNSRYGPALKLIMDSHSARGKLFDVPPFVPPSNQDILSKYRRLMPLMLSSVMSKEASLVAFKNKAEEYIWFSSIAESATAVKCLDPLGRIKELSFVAIGDKGFNRVDLDGASLSQECKRQIGGTVEGSDVRKVLLFIGKHTIPSFRQDKDRAKLVSMLADFPDLNKKLAPTINEHRIT